MPDPRQLTTEYAAAAASNADIVSKADYWSERLRHEGKHAEAAVMYELATEVMLLRGLTGAKPSTKPARRGPAGEAFRAG